MKQTSVLALALCMIMPLSVQAITEDVIQEAPMVDMYVESQIEEISYLPDSSYYAGAFYQPDWENAETWLENTLFADDMYHDVSQNPCLTMGEAKRAQTLLEAYHAGTAAYAGESVLDKMENVIVGVYTLDPSDYDGEKAYVILPGTCLMDEQLLSIIAAFDELGLSFDPMALNYRNCTRGGGIETTRFFTAEEFERYNNLANSIKRGTLILPENLEGLLRNPKLDSKYFCGMDDFSIKPYRSMTDEELVSLLLAIGIRDESKDIDHVAAESRSRNALCTVLGCPLSMELSSTYSQGSYILKRFTADGQIGYGFDAKSRSSFGASFTYNTPSGILVHAFTTYDKETNELVSLSSMDDKGMDSFWFADEPCHVDQEYIDASTQAAEAQLGLSGLKWYVITNDITSTNWGACLPVRAQIDENWFFTIYIGCDDGLQHGMELTRGILVDTLPAYEFEDSNG